MSEPFQEMVRIQQLVGNAYTKTGALVALGDGGRMSEEKLQKTLEQTMEDFERATLALRSLCEQASPGVGGYAQRPSLPRRDVTGYVERFGFDWLHICVNTLLPHCRYQTPGWLTDTILRLLDDFEEQGNTLPYYQKALLVIDEYSSLENRRIFDQDNKGWKAVSNALKGRLFSDDDQDTLSYALLSTTSEVPACHITLLPQAEASSFFDARSRGQVIGHFY